MTISNSPIQRIELQVIVWTDPTATAGQAVFAVSEALGNAGMNVDVVAVASSDTCCRVVQDED